MTPEWAREIYFEAQSRAKDEHDLVGWAAVIQAIRMEIDHEWARELTKQIEGET